MAMDLPPSYVDKTPVVQEQKKELVEESVYSKKWITTNSGVTLTLDHTKDTVCKTEDFTLEKGCIKTKIWEELTILKAENPIYSSGNEFGNPTNTNVNIALSWSWPWLWPLTPDMVVGYNSINRNNQAFVKSVLSDIFIDNAWQMDKSFLALFWTVISYFQSLEDSGSKSYQAVVELENAITGFSFQGKENIAIKLAELRTQAINHFLQKVSPKLVNNQQFISILKDWQAEAELNWLWTRNFFRHLNNWYWEKAKWYMAKAIFRNSPTITEFFFNNRDSFWNISSMVAELEETKVAEWYLAKELEETKVAEWYLAKELEETKVAEWYLAKEKQKRSDSEVILDIAKNI